jgi:hypothetical protein
MMTTPSDKSSRVSKATKIKRRLIWFVVFIVVCVVVYPFVKETLPVEMVRSAIRRVPPAQLWADDLADDVRSKRRLAPLQEWSVQALARYRVGKLATSGKSAYGWASSVRLAPDEIPSWLSGAWWKEGGEKPEVSVGLNESKEPECIIVGWYLCGLMVGSPEYINKSHPWYIVQVKPGIYAYSVEK